MPAAKKAASTETPAKQLAGFIAKYDPKVAALARECRAAMRKKLPSANELVYDNYQFLAIGYSSTELRRARGDGAHPRRGRAWTRATPSLRQGPADHQVDLGETASASSGCEGEANVKTVCPSY
ncbi:MAG TPA: hypothetical protein VIM15_04480 [Gemmatimonadaceae bacterium]